MFPDRLFLDVYKRQNQYSASASEIFSGAVQDYGIGEIVGMTTYGKGVVQQLMDLGDGTCLKMTIAEYYKMCIRDRMNAAGGSSHFIKNGLERHGNSIRKRRMRQSAISISATRGLKCIMIKK